MEEYNDIVAANPNYAPTYREIAETYHLWSLLPTVEEDQYKELNKKGVEQYKKYIELTGDKSIEAKIRYADFLVYAREYNELKTVSEELAKNPDIDPKVYRYLGFVSYIDKDYAKAAEYLGVLFQKMNENRIIALDYMFAGLSAAELNDNAKASELLKKAMTEDADLIEQVAETAFVKYQDKNYETSIALFKAVAELPKSDYYYDAVYYQGEANYLLGYGKTQEEQDGSAYFKASADALTTIINADNKEAKEKFYIKALYYRAWTFLAQDDLEKPKGDYVPDFQKFIDVLNETNKVADFESWYLDANNYVGFFYYTKADNKKAKPYFDKVLSLDAENDFALQMIDFVK